MIGPQNAGSFAKLLNGADSRAGRAEEVGFENRLSRAQQILVRDPLDKRRDIDVGGARVNAGRVVAIEAPVGF